MTRALVATVALSVAFAQPSAAPAAFTGRNGDVLYAKQLVKPTARAMDLYAIRPGDGSAIRLTRTPESHEFDPAASKDILRANAAGSGVRRVARVGAAFRLAFRSGIDWRVR